MPAHSLDTADLELTLISTRIAKEGGVDGLCLCRISDACDLKFSKFIVQGVVEADSNTCASAVRFKAALPLSTVASHSQHGGTYYCGRSSTDDGFSPALAYVARISAACALADGLHHSVNIHVLDCLQVNKTYRVIPLVRPSELHPVSRMIHST